jgi:hypothetical protein
MAKDLSPFVLSETTPGTWSLTLTEFGPANQVFEVVGSEGGGYAWDVVGTFVAETMDAEQQGRLGFDPEASMFCAYGEDREALAALGERLARLFHDHAALARVLDEIGPERLGAD